MATVEKRGKVWRTLIRRKGFRTESATFRLKAQADAWATEREAELIGSRHGIIPKRTVRQAIERYMEEVCPKHEGRRWEQIRLAKILRNLEWADCDLAKVGTNDVATWRDSMGHLSAYSVRREYGLLRAVFTICVREWGWLKDSPFRSVECPPDGSERTRRISDDEAAAIVARLGYADGLKPETASQYVACALLLALETAMRKGEILGIRPEHVNERTVHLPKTKNGTARDVPLTKRAKAILDLCDNEFPVASDTLDTLFRRARKNAGIVDLHFHDARREATSRLAAKVDVMTLAKITGHKDIKLLLRVYYAPKMNEVALTLD